MALRFFAASEISRRVYFRKIHSLLDIIFEFLPVVSRLDWPLAFSVSQTLAMCDYESWILTASREITVVCNRYCTHFRYLLPDYMCNVLHLLSHNDLLSQLPNDIHVSFWISIHSLKKKKINGRAHT